MQATITLDCKPESNKYWLREIGDLDWPILANTAADVSRVCHYRNATAHSVASACLKDPLLCWLLSRRANTIISDRDKWPSDIEHIISLLGIPQVAAIAKAAPKQQLGQDEYAVLERCLISSIAAQQLFNLLAPSINPQWLGQHSLSCLFYQLPLWALALKHRRPLLQLECLASHKHNTLANCQVQILGCSLAVICHDLGQETPILGGCRAAWRLPSENFNTHVRLAAGNFRQRQNTGIQHRHLSPELLIVFCHNLVLQQWQPRKFKQAMRLLSGLNGKTREELQHYLHQAQLNMPWPEGASRSLHPMRKTLCQWQDNQWLPKPVIPPKLLTSGAAATDISLEPAIIDSGAFANEVLKRRIRSLLATQFTSFGSLFKFIGESLELGFSHSQGCVLVRAGKQLQSAYQYGFENDLLNRSGIDLENRPADIIQKLMAKPGSIQFEIKASRIPKEFQPIFSEGRYIGISSVHIGNRGTALLVIQSRQRLDDDSWRQFKQFGHAFHQSLLGLMRQKHKP